MNKLVTLATVMLLSMSSAIVAENSDDVRYFMFVGEPNAAALKRGKQFLQMEKNLGGDVNDPR
jgi:hypothetical protein